MPRKAKELSALEVNRLKEAGAYFVGGVAGLLLQVTETGARTWILRTMVGGKRRDIGLGGFPTVTLAQAREKARITREKIKQGTDPIEENRKLRNDLAAARAAAITFQEAAEKYIKANETGWKNAKHAAQWTATLETYAYPMIGRMQVGGIDTPHVLSVLEPIWTTKTETASRVRGRIESVLDWAKVRGYRKGENPARWKGHLDHLLPARNKVQKIVNQPALPFEFIHAFMTALAKVEGMGARALEFAILTAARSGEVRGATWAEFDLEKSKWTIPAERMKAGKEHEIPLSAKAVSLLKALPKQLGTTLAFPSSKNGVLSDMTMTAVIRRMDESSIKDGSSGWRDSSGKIITAHGFRSTFRDWAGETTSHPREVIEHALAHKLKDKAEASYARGTLFDKRRALMTDWSEYCCGSHADS